MTIQKHLLAICGASLFQGQMVSAYELHEWGTFTTVSGSDGGLLAGVEVEEEHLPPFVYSHIGMRGLSSPYSPFYYTSFSPGSLPFQNKQQISVALQQAGIEKVLHQDLGSLKGIERALLENVTVKMETPVIYIYGDDAPKVNIKVGFNGGTISQWYPQRKSGDTPNLVPKDQYTISPQLQQVLGGRDMVFLRQPINFGDQTKPYQGAIEWDVEVLPKSDADPALTFKTDENPTWIYPRVPSANVLKVGEEHEDFLFYRGVGNFALPATFGVDATETVIVKNRSKQAIPFAFAFENIGGVFRYKTIGAVAPGATAQVAETEWIKPQSAATQKIEVFQQMRQGLMAQGLNADEANGMVKTWWKSYFDKTGLRVFWIVPQSDLEQVLPLQASPTPAKKVRVLVGRADIMRPQLEQQMIADLGTKAYHKYTADRFFPSYTNRLKQLVKEPVFQKFDEENLADSYQIITAKKGETEKRENIYLAGNHEIQLQHLKLSGKWQIIGNDQLKIGDTVFHLDAKTGMLTAKATDDPNYETYQIQLSKAL